MRPHHLQQQPLAYPGLHVYQRPANVEVRPPLPSPFHAPFYPAHNPKNRRNRLRPPLLLPRPSSLVPTLHRLVDPYPSHTYHTSKRLCGSDISAHYHPSPCSQHHFSQHPPSTQSHIKDPSADRDRQWRHPPYGLLGSADTSNPTTNTVLPSQSLRSRPGEAGRGPRTQKSNAKDAWRRVQGWDLRGWMGVGGYRRCDRKHTRRGDIGGTPGQGEEGDGDEEEAVVAESRHWKQG